MCIYVYIYIYLYIYIYYRYIGRGALIVATLRVEMFPQNIGSLFIICISLFRTAALFFFVGLISRKNPANPA